MSKTKFLTALVLGLLLINVGLVAMVLFNEPPPPKFKKGEGPRAYIIEELNLDEAQVDEYNALIEEHKTAFKALNQKVEKIRFEVYTGITNGQTIAERDSLIDQLGDYQEAIEQLHCAHFSDLKVVCREDQQEAFSVLMGEVVGLLQPPKIKK